MVATNTYFVIRHSINGCKDESPSTSCHLRDVILVMTRMKKQRKILHAQQQVWSWKHKPKQLSVHRRRQRSEHIMPTTSRSKKYRQGQVVATQWATPFRNSQLHRVQDEFKTWNMASLQRQEYSNHLRLVSSYRMLRHCEDARSHARWFV